MKKKILVISNNVFSTIYNNGKTIYSLIQTLPKEDVAQLYFNRSLPEIAEYNYFRLSDSDILRGQLKTSLRGGTVESVKNQNDHSVFQPESTFPRNNLTLFLREIVWKNAWKSKQLDEWLDEFRPDVVFFVAGDCLFAYRICAYIVKKYHSRLDIYVTDDYVLPRNKESILGRYRRKKIFEVMAKCVKQSSNFFTISERMREEYKILYGKDSKCFFNASESLRDDTLCKVSDRNESVILTYAGSLYYGREDVLWMLLHAIVRFNEECPNLKKAQLHIYSNSKPRKEFLIEVQDTDCVSFLGGIDQEQLKEKLNFSNILVFVESFAPEQIEKTRLSLSTKIPEYMSLGKPILAIGPSNIGSMDYLQDVAMCVNNERNIYNKLKKLLTSTELQRECSKKALEKYKQSHELLFECQRILL